jgi:hypothetical protein
MANPSEPRCRICTSPDRASIEQAILNGRAQSAVARTFNLGSRVGTPEFKPDHKIVARHIAHMGALYQQTRTTTLEEAGNALHARMAELDAAVDETLRRVRQGMPVMADGVPVLDENGHPARRYDERTLLAAVREARRNVDMRARLEGIVPEGEADAVAAARLALQTPEARNAVAQLEAMLAEHGSGERG